MEEQISVFLAKTGAQAIYREDRSFARVKIVKTQVDGDFLVADVEYLDTPGMNTDNAGMMWEIRLHNEMSSWDEDEWHSPYSSKAVYFGDDLILTIMKQCALLPDSDFGDFNEIASFLSRYWQRQRGEVPSYSTYNKTYERRLLAQSYDRIGQLYSAAGDEQRAIANLKACLNIYNELYVLHPDLTNLSGDLIFAEMMMGNYYSKIDSRQARKYYKLAVSRNLQLRKDSPRCPHVDHDTAILSRNIGDFFLGENNFEKALEYYKASLNFSKNLCKQLPGVEEYEQEFVVINDRIHQLNLK